MTSRPNIRDVAALAGVSIASVSYTLNEPSRVSEATRTKVLDAIQELDFVVNSAARSMRSGVRGLGIVVGELRHSFVLEVIRGAQQTAREAERTMVIGHGDDNPVETANYVRLFDQARLEGIILTSNHDSSKSFEEIRSKGRRVVLVNYRSTSLDHCQVLMDNVEVGKIATRHLAEQGCREIVWVSGEGENQPLDDRLIGVRRATSQLPNVELREVLVRGLSRSDGRDAARILASMAEASEAVDGIIVGTEMLARGIIEALHATTGLRVPRDIRVVATDWNADADAGDTPISAVVPPAYEMGREATKLLLDEINDPQHAHERIMLKATLRPDESSTGERTPVSI